jgi:hypothetical protein
VVFGQAGQISKHVHPRKSCLGLKLLSPLVRRSGPGLESHQENRATALDALQVNPILNVFVPSWVRPPVTADVALPQGRAARSPGCMRSRPRDLLEPSVFLSGRVGLLFGFFVGALIARPSQRGRG